MLGRTADAEDVLQESWLRWADVDLDEVRDARAYLARIVTSQALNRLRSLKRQREEYVGTWLPEPLATTPDVAEDVELADSVSFAMLVVLETLSPLERAVFVLREVFGFGYDEIAEATERTQPAVRQVARRAREHVQARRPRVAAPTATRDEVAERFFVAARTGDVQQLMDLLAPDVVLLSDGGGKVKAALRPIHGADKVARWLMGVAPKGEVSIDWAMLNGAPAALISVDGRFDSVASMDTEAGRITRIYYVRNPDKLAALSEQRTLTR
jgi:RNA polymerase sigma-70 factor (ECF subfamily)